jgi:hypothetical protein
MEVVGVVASFTGILAFTGQAIEGVLQLRRFFKDITLAPRRTGELLRDLEGLGKTLSEIEELVVTLQGCGSMEAGAAATGQILKTHLTSCADDVTMWVGVTRRADPRSEKGLKAFFRKVKIVADKSGFEEFGRKISSHQQRLGISLSVLGRSVFAHEKYLLGIDDIPRYLDHAGIKHLDDLSTKFDGLTQAHLQLNDSINTKLADRFGIQPVDLPLSAILEKELQPLKSRMRASTEDQLERMSANYSESQQSLSSLSRSVSSLASQLSQLLERTQPDELNQMPKSPELEETAEPHTEWSCDALSGIDDAFDEHGLEQHCIYCSENFIERTEKPYSSHARAEHVTAIHSFGSCNLWETYNSWDQFEEHLHTYHNMTDKNNRIVARFLRRKRPHLTHLSRGDSHGQPFRIEMSAESALIAVKLKQALYEAGSRRNPDSRVGLASLAQLTLRVLEEMASKTWHLSREEWAPLNNVACIVEELIVSGHYYEQKGDNGDNELNEVHPMERSIIDSIGLSVMKDLGGPAAFTQRARVNEWLFQIFEESCTLWLFLRSGSIIPEIRNTTSLDWVIPVVEYWNIDEAATGAEQPYETSEGAVDSREDPDIELSSLTSVASMVSSPEGSYQAPAGLSNCSNDKTSPDDGCGDTNSWDFFISDFKNDEHKCLLCENTCTGPTHLREHVEKHLAKMSKEHVGRHLETYLREM